jgi:protein SCO1/2
MNSSRTLALIGILAAVTPAHAADAPFGGAVRFEQRIGEALPLATEFVDATGVRHPLGDFFDGKPVVLYFGYARCPQLCSVVGDGTVAALRQIRADVGRDLTVVSISLDPEETPAAARGRQNDAIHRYGNPRSAAGWHFLRGDDAAIRAIADAAGFHYVYDPRSRQYAHASGFVVVRPDGIISRTFFGVDFPAPEVAQAIDDAAHNRAGRRALDLLLLCFRGEGAGGRTTAIIARVLAVAVVLTVFTLGSGIAWMLRRERLALRRNREVAL